MHASTIDLTGALVPVDADQQPPHLTDHLLWPIVRVCLQQNGVASSTTRQERTPSNRLRCVKGPNTRTASLEAISTAHNQSPVATSTKIRRGHQERVSHRSGYVHEQGGYALPRTVSSVDGDTLSLEGR